VLFSLAALRRSLPSLVDGLKPSQRKVLHACFKRRLAAPAELKASGARGGRLSGGRRLTPPPLLA